MSNFYQERRIRPNRNICVRICWLALLPFVAQAQDFRLIDNFQDGDDADWRFWSQSEDAFSMVAPDPESLENQVVFILPESFNLESRTYHSKRLPYSIGEGDTVTIYWRGHFESQFGYWAVMLSDEDSPTSDAMIVADLDYDFRVLSSGITGYTEEESIFAVDLSALTEEAWCQFWMVIDYDASGFELYIKTGNDQAPVGPIPLLGGGTQAPFRRAPEGAIRTLSLHTFGHLNEPRSESYFDDIHIAKGKDLREFYLLEAWPTTSGWPVVDEGNADAAGWLGHVNVAHDPWIWSWTMNTWLYTPPGMITNDGGWTYALR